MTARRVLFLQGPHGPFFDQLARQLRRAGHETWRVGFTAGDRVFWRGPGFLGFREDAAAWPAWLAQVLDQNAITDMVAYNDLRPIHAEALRQARTLGLTCHVFEEGYLRPHWVTYERHGSYQNSRFGTIAPSQWADLAKSRSKSLRRPPADRWGDLRQHMVYGALYHMAVALGRGYPNYVPHRGISVWTEAGLTLRRLLGLPYRWINRRRATHHILDNGGPFHLVLLQLAHDPQFRAACPVPSQCDLISDVAGQFRASAPQHHHLVFKAHPLEDGRENLRRAVRQAAHEKGLTGRIHFVDGGKLAHLLNDAKSVVTVNSTAAHQALWRGLPVFALGPALFRVAGLSSDQTLGAFFAAPRPPDPELYAAFRDALLATSQIEGSFYAAPGRRRLLRQIVDRMLSKEDAYDFVPKECESVAPQVIAFAQASLAKSPKIR